MLVSESFLKDKNISLHSVERGGNITYHGPGQLVVYAIVHLPSKKMGVLDFVEKVEDVMIRTTADYDIHGTRNTLNRCVWVGKKKLGSIGIAVRRGVTFHGMALNVNTDLVPFSWISPCGLKQVEMTSMAYETESSVSIAQIKKSAQQHWQSVFGVQLKSRTLSDMSVLLGKTDG